MTRPIRIAAILLALCWAPALRADLARAKAEPNLERRARLAMENANLQLRSASDADRKGDWPAVQAALKELGESVDLAYASLKQTGKSPRNSRHYKDLEVKLRGVIKNLDGFRNTLDLDEREQFVPLAEHLRQIHDEVLQSVMVPKKK